MPDSTKTFYPDEFKESSAKLEVESDQPVSKTAESLGVKETPLYGWVTKYYRNYSNVNKPELNESDAEIRRLKKELTQVQQERDILEKSSCRFNQSLQNLVQFIYRG